MISKSLEDTEKAAGDFLSHLIPRAEGATIVRLAGDLGSGKTTFVRCAAGILGARPEEVTSPTFVIMKSYSLKLVTCDFKTLVHIDAYRLDDPRDAEKLRLAEVFADPRNLVFIEWPEKIAAHMPQKAATISFRFIDENTREIEVQ
ncbi:MAG: tRNA (adenosine(37)-N6)-threonylcarbamoyltransferase complex ATPase subunit type 1 TsaE [Candidatus Paceibacterota bacterium]|jgi:tRNA threonylcarbamoyladenosine biosynthesis protein TsaE